MGSVGRIHGMLGGRGGRHDGGEGVGPVVEGGV